jgi:tetratricopeptide (TPR) repeat protein
MTEHLFPQYERGRTLMQLNRHEAAIEALQEGLTGEATDGLYLTSIGQCYYLLENLPAAEKNLKAAIAATPGDSYAHCLLGMTFLHGNNMGEAKKQLEASLELAPEDKFPLLGLAKYFMINQAYSEAERYTDEALNTDPDFLDALQLKTILLTQRGADVEARRVIETALHLNPNNPDSLKIAGYASDTGGNPKAAELFYGKSLHTQPSADTAHQYLQAKARATTRISTSPYASAMKLFVGLIVFVPATMVSIWISSPWFDWLLITICLVTAVYSLLPFLHIAYSSWKSFGKILVFNDWHQARNSLHFIGGVASLVMYLYSKQDFFFSVCLFFFSYGLIGIALQVVSSKFWKKIGFILLGGAYVIGLINFVLYFTKIGSVKLVSQGLFVGLIAFCVVFYFTAKTETKGNKKESR